MLKKSLRFFLIFSTILCCGFSFASSSKPTKILFLRNNLRKLHPPKQPTHVTKRVDKGSPTELHIQAVANNLIQSSIRRSLKNQEATSTPDEITESKRPSSLFSINVLMLLFYGTLGSVMPYLPIFYKFIGANGKK